MTTAGKLRILREYSILDLRAFMVLLGSGIFSKAFCGSWRDVEIQFWNELEVEDEGY